MLLVSSCMIVSYIGQRKPFSYTKPEHFCMWHQGFTQIDCLEGEQKIINVSKHYREKWNAVVRNKMRRKVSLNFLCFLYFFGVEKVTTTNPLYKTSDPYVTPKK